MQTINKVVYKCEYCGYESEDLEFMKVHEECCALNPQNQPCSKCSNLILDIGCSKRVAMESVGANVSCFFYKEGRPRTALETLLQVDGNHPDDL